MSIFSNSITGSILGNSVGTSSFSVTSSYSVSASYAATASYAIALVNPVEGGAAISASAPTLKPSGALWWNTDDGNLYVQVTSPTGSNYVAAMNTVAGSTFGATFRGSYNGTTWTVNHNLGTTSPLIQVYSGSAVMIPASIVSTDANTSTITFASGFSGSVVASTGVGGTTTASLALNATNAVSASTAGTTITGSVTITGTTSNPTKGTRSRDIITLIDRGNGYCDVVMNYFQTTGGTDGVGDYLFTLPGGYQFDTNFHGTRAVAGNPGANGQIAIIPGSNGFAFETLDYAGMMYAMVWDATRFRILSTGYVTIGANGGYMNPVGAAWYNMSQANVGFQIAFTFKKA